MVKQVTKSNRYFKPNLPEVHIAVLGANGSGKSGWNCFASDVWFCCKKNYA